MPEAIRFGVDLLSMPAQMEFGDWGYLETSVAFDLFTETHAYFDQEAVQKQEQKRADLIRTARKYYDGEHIKPLVVKPGEVDDNVLINLCRTLTDDSVSWLFGNPETGILSMNATREARPVETEEGPETGEGVDDLLEPEEEDPDAAEVGRLLEQVYQESRGFHFFKRLGIRGSIAGHFFIKIVPRDNRLPKLVPLDPLLVTVRTNPVDTDEVIAYKIEWKQEERDPRSGRRDTIIYRQLVVQVNTEENAWIVGDFKAKDRRKREWNLVNAWAWPYKWAPIVDGPNVLHGWSYYGLSEMEDTAGLNASINLLASNTMRILRHHAHPKTIGTGVQAGEVTETNIDSFWTIANPEAKIYNLEMTSDLISSMHFLDFLRTAFWTIGRGMDPSVFKDKIGQVTNFALRVLAIRAIQKMGDKRLSYGEALIEVNRRVLEILGKTGYTTSIKWPTSMPEDPKDLIQRLETEVELEITSRQTAAEEVGRSWQTERRRIASEKKERQTLGQYFMDEFDRALPAGGLDEERSGNESREPEA